MSNKVYAMIDGKKIELGTVDNIELVPGESEESQEYVYDMNKIIESIEIPLDMTYQAKRMLYAIVGSKMADNNWRKHHHLPMWRK